MEVMGEVVLTNEGCVPYYATRQHLTPSTLQVRQLSNRASKKNSTFDEKGSPGPRRKLDSGVTVFAEKVSLSARKFSAAAENSFPTHVDNEDCAAVETILDQSGEVLYSSVIEDGADSRRYDQVSVETVVDKDREILYSSVMDDDDVHTVVGGDVVTEQQPSGIIIQMTPEGLTEVVGRELTSEEKSQGRNPDRDSVSQNETRESSFEHGETTVGSFSQGDSEVAVENEVQDGMNATPCKVCKYCLRAFASPFLLYRHVSR